MGSFLLALQFFTIVTLKRELTADARQLAATRAWYGPVGVMIGLFLAGTAWLLGLALPQTVLAGVILAVWALFTRFLHLDGVADVADALGTTHGRERALEIMKDSRVGAFGLAAVVLLLIVKFGALVSLSGPRLWAALIVAPALGRALAGMLAALLPNARSGGGLGGSIGSGEKRSWEIMSCGAALAAALLAGGMRGAVAALAVVVLGAVLGRWYYRRLGGFTGDTLGASIEMAEALVLVVFAAGV